MRAWEDSWSCPIKVRDGSQCMWPLKLIPTSVKLYSMTFVEDRLYGI